MDSTQDSLPREELEAANTKLLYQPPNSLWLLWKEWYHQNVGNWMSQMPSFPGKVKELLLAANPSQQESAIVEKFQTWAKTSPSPFTFLSKCPCAKIQPKGYSSWIRALEKRHRGRKLARGESFTVQCLYLFPSSILQPSCHSAYLWNTSTVTEAINMFYIKHVLFVITPQTSTRITCISICIIY